MHLISRHFAPALALCASAVIAQTPTLRIGLCGAASTTNTACQWTDVQTRLLASGQFAAVDILNVTSSGIGTPTLQQLLHYDALMCWTNSTPASNVAWGDVLADYVDAGGGVVVTVFANSTLTAGRNIGGRWQNGYEVILDQSGNLTGVTTLGTVHVPSHPVMTGVTAYSGSTRPTGTALEVGATLIAETADGKVLVAQGQNPRRIDLGFYPPNATCSASGWTVGGDQLMVNALVAVATTGVYGPFGAGCAGSTGTPTLLAQGGSQPVLGNVLLLELGQLPNGIGIVGAGFSATQSGTFTLPYDLTPVGMPGCSLLVDPAVSTLVLGSPSAIWPFVVPNAAGLVGLTVFAQGFVLDAGANAIGLAASNAGRIHIGH